MSNRTGPLTRAKVALPPADPLQALFDSCHRNGRPAKFPRKEPKIYFDADRFRWWFRQPDNSYNTLQQWRDSIDAQMRLDESAST